MSANTILSWFSKSGPYHSLSRRFHNLSRQQKEACIALIQSGLDVAKAVRKVRK